jgi:hypothetical protein
MPAGPMATFGALFGLLYLRFLALMIGGWIYLLMKVSEISRDAGIIAAQQEQHSRSLALLADSVVTLARSPAAAQAVPSVPLEP